MRRTAASPQTCAMSVALEDQGDTVPKRGTVNRFAPPWPDVARPLGVEQALEDGVLGGREFARRVDEVDELDRDRPHARLDAPQRREQPLDPEARECGRAPEPQHQAVNASRPGRRRRDTG